jgi:hypothetical protein
MVKDVLGDELRADALDVLRDALEWRMSSARWTAVAAGIEALSTAVRSGDVARSQAAVYELELCGPVRASGFGDPPVPAPEPVREEINELVHTLDGRTASG